jgi:hypothetical protein
MLSIELAFRLQLVKRRASVIARGVLRCASEDDITSGDASPRKKHSEADDSLSFLPLPRPYVHLCILNDTALRHARAYYRSN